MKTKAMIGTALLCATFVFTSCDNDDDRYLPESAVLQAFSAKYPNAKRTEWESKYGYKKAEFHIGSQELEAWFDAQGNWLLTETDISYNALPQAVKDAFKAGQYAAWKVDDVDMLERPDAPTVYVIEVEKGGQEVELHYTADGILVKEILDNDHDNEHRPAVTPDAVRLLIQTLYPGAVILEVETEHTGTEVDILHGGIHKEVLLDTANQWILTEWEIRQAQVPEAVMAALRASDYASFRIDDIHVIETPQGLFYEFELERGGQETKVRFTQDGTLVQ